MSAAPRAIGPYTVIRVLGRGGMGVVYEGLDPVVGRRVALKVLLEAGLDADALLRFEREARLLARVKHPNVVTIHSIERVDRSPVLVTELIEGARPLEPGKLPPREAAALVCALADGVEAVHQAGVLHRDLKPDNVMRRADGSVVLLDFGVAREMDGSSLTRTGELLGTPSFMAPEQVLGQRGGLDARADVYGLGALLYALLVGSPPFEGNMMTVLAAVLETDPRWPRDRVAAPAGLDAIVRRAMAKRPADRQPSAAALRDELDLWLAEPERPPARPVAAIVLVALAAVSAATGLAFVATRDAPPEATPPVVEVAPAESLSPVSIMPAVVDSLDDHLMAARGGSLAPGLRESPLFVEAPPLELRPEARREVRAEFLDARRLVVVMPGATRAALARVTPTKFEWTSLPGASVGPIERALPCAGQVAFGGQRGVELLDPAASQRRRLTKDPVDVRSMVSAGVRLLFTDEERVWVVDADGEAPRQVLDLGPTSPKRRVELALSPDGADAVVLVVETDGVVRDAFAYGLRLSDPPDAPGASVRLDLPAGMTRKGVALAANRRVALGGDSFSLEVWTAGTDHTLLFDAGEVLYLPSLHTVVFSPRGRVVYAASQTNKSHMTNELVAWTPGGAARRVKRSDAISSLAVSPDGLLLAVGTFEGDLELWVAGDDVQ